jgi:hypothetical protein
MAAIISKTGKEVIPKQRHKDAKGKGAAILDEKRHITGCLKTFSTGG